jgi:hypothetical protein
VVGTLFIFSQPLVAGRLCLYTTPAVAERLLPLNLSLSIRHANKVPKLTFFGETARLSEGGALT